MEGDLCTNVYPNMIEFEKKGLITRTFRRLDPDRQHAIIDAIITEGSKNGPSRLNVKNIAARAGVSVGSLYQYFRNRQGLMDFSVELVVTSTVAAMNQVSPYLAEMPLLEAIKAYLTTGIEWSSRQTGLIGFFASAAYQGDPMLHETVVLPVSQVMLEVVQKILTAAASRAELRAEMDNEALAHLLNAFLIAIGDAQLYPLLNDYYRLFDLQMPPERILSAFLDLLESGILPAKLKMADPMP